MAASSSASASSDPSSGRDRRRHDGRDALKVRKCHRPREKRRRRSCSPHDSSSSPTDSYRMSDSPDSSRIGQLAGTSHTGETLAQEKTVIQWSEDGQPIGPGSEVYSSVLGELTRTHCPIRYSSWRLVPNHAKDGLMVALQRKYTVPRGVRTQVLKKANEYWRNYKLKLRQRFIDLFPTVPERLAHCPLGVRFEDWEIFVDLESTPEAAARREKAKVVRSAMTSPHTTGRRGAARTAEQLRLQDPSRVLTRTDRFLATHTRRDGTCPTPELSTQVEGIRAIAASDPSSTSLDPDHDPVAQVCGPEHRGRVRGYGSGVSRRALRDSGPARERLSQAEAARASLQEQLDQFKKETRGELRDLRANLLTRRLRSFATGSSETTVSDCRTSLPSQESQGEHPCDLLHVGRRLVGLGRVMFGGDPAPDGFHRVILDVALDPDAVVLTTEPVDDALGEMVDACFFWPACFLRIH